MNKKWCICNNTGIIIIPASSIGCKTANNELSLHCPICQEFEQYLTADELIQIIKLSKINNEPIIHFRMNPYYINYLTKQLYFSSSVCAKDNSFYGYPIVVDNSIKGIEIDYV